MNSNDITTLTHTNNWNSIDILNWQESHKIHRDYHDTVVKPVRSLSHQLDIVRYGALSLNVDRYPLYAVKNHNWHPHHPVIFISAGIHGCEVSGIKALLEFLRHDIFGFIHSFNFICAVCVSPWSYETNNRWNPVAQDPNRQFFANTECEEASHLMRLFAPYQTSMLAHFDLHGTTPSDDFQFKSEWAERYGIHYDPAPLPNGSMIIGDIDAPELAFLASLRDGLKSVVRVARPNASHKILGQRSLDDGVILYSGQALGLSTGHTRAKYRAVIKSLESHNLAAMQKGIDAQIAALRAGLSFLLKYGRNA